MPYIVTNPGKFQELPAAYNNPYIVPNMGQIEHSGMINHRRAGHGSHSQRNGNSGVSTNRKRRRKSPLQLGILNQEYIKNKDWSKELIVKISETTGLSESQIYKWNWD